MKVTGLLAALRAGCIAAPLAAACGGAPKYDPPKPDMPVAWKVEAPFREGAPNDAAPKGEWWKRFDDPVLNELQEKALAGNPTLAAAYQRVAQARATLTATGAARSPQVAAVARAQRFRITENRPLNNYAAPNFSTTQNDFLVGLAAAYEVDFAGRVSSLVSGAQASYEQSAADLENVRLLLTADLAAAIARSADATSGRRSRISEGTPIGTAGGVMSRASASMENSGAGVPVRVASAC